MSPYSSQRHEVLSPKPLRGETVLRLCDLGYFFFSNILCLVTHQPGLPFLFSKYQMPDIFLPTCSLITLSLRFTFEAFPLVQKDFLQYKSQYQPRESFRNRTLFLWASPLLASVQFRLIYQVILLRPDCMGRAVSPRFMCWNPNPTSEHGCLCREDL